MAVVVITPPAAIVSQDEAKRHLRVDTSSDDGLIDALIATASAAIEPPDGWAGRAFGVQVLEMRLNGYGWHGDLALPCPPLRELLSVTYDDANGVEQTLDPTVYRIVGAGGTDVARLALAYGKAWPKIRFGPEAVRVRYEAGYAADDPKLLPAKQAVLLMVGDLYAHRESVIVGATVAAIPNSATVEALLQRYRVY